MTKTRVFSGIAMAQDKIANLREQLDGRTAQCHVVRDPASAPAVAYSRRLVDLGAQAGIRVVEAGYDEVQALRTDVAQAPVIFLHPAPPVIDVPALITALGPGRDAEALHPVNLGKLLLGVQRIVPPTAQAALLVAEHLLGPLEGKRVAVVGASERVGLPVAILLIQRGATVRIAHKRTRNLAAETCDAELVISAAGVPGLISGHHIAAGAHVIDIGLTPVEGKLVGDVDLAAVEGRVGVTTHVPDGVGPLTAACLLENIAVLILHDQVDES
jgi:methylenetetrahydrofolate dehydrogenase (NADP+)/methenyltetrahydrofolate cyclohydrolase